MTLFYSLEEILSDIKEKKLTDNDYIIIDNLSKCNEELLDYDKAIYVNNIHPKKHASNINTRMILDYIKLQGYNIEDFFDKYKIYSRNIFDNYYEWVPLSYHFNFYDNIEEFLNFKNPREYLKISKIANENDKTMSKFLEIVSRFFSLQKIYELVPLFNRNYDNDITMKFITTIKTKNKIKFILTSRYFNNFFDAVQFRFLQWSIGLLSGIPARWGYQLLNTRICYYGYDLKRLLTVDYKYKNLGKLEEKENGFYLDGDIIAKKVLLKKEIIKPNYSLSKKIFNLSKNIKYNHKIYSPISYEIDNNNFLNNNESIICYEVIKDVFDNEAKEYILKKGELFNLPYTRFEYEIDLKSNKKFIFDRIFNSRNKLLETYLSKLRAQVVELEEAKSIAINEANEAKLARDQLKELYKNLELKVKERTADLQQSKAEVELLSQQKTDFFVNVSHEIRTPLTLLKCFLDKYINKIDDKKGDDLQIIVKSYNKLERDVLNFFDIERFNIGKQVYDNSKTSNFSIILKENLHLFSELFISNKITIKTNIENNIIIEIDPQGLDRIIYNIIDNAIKYNRECGTIEITLKKNNDNIIFIVKDNGIGIKEEQQKYIFEPYYQASHPKNNYQGIGVGLSIVKRIVDSVNANIEIYSKQNECTEIKIIFNKYLEKPETKIEVVEHKEIISYIDSRELIKINENGKQYTLLIVEDNLDTLAMLIISFRDNYNVYPAKSGLEALNMLENMIKTPSVIISDIMMDNMDGVEFLNKLKQREEYKDIPVIFLTAKDMQQQKLSGLKQGAIDYITKPFSMDEIKAKVETHTKNRELTIDKIADNIINQATKMKQSKMSKENQQKITFDEKCKIYNLSDKEKEIVHYIIQGKATKEISSILNIGEKAISSRLTSIYNKTNTTGRIELSNLF